MLNIYDQQKRLEVQIACAYNAAQSGFKFLPIRFVINPPRQMPEAMLARQVAVHIMRTVFNIPRRRICASLSRQRTSISLNIQKINRRLQDPVFAREYAKWANRARNAYAREMQKNGLQEAA